MYKTNPRLFLIKNFIQSSRRNSQFFALSSHQDHTNFIDPIQDTPLSPDRS